MEQTIPLEVLSKLLSESVLRVHLSSTIIMYLQAVPRLGRQTHNGNIHESNQTLFETPPPFLRIN